MLTGENKSKIDKIWDAFWSGGIRAGIDLHTSAAIGGIGHGLRDDIDRYPFDFVRVGSWRDCRSGRLHEGRQIRST